MNLYISDSSFKVGGESYPGFPILVNERGGIVEVILMYLKYALLESKGANDAKTWDTYGRHLYDYFGFLEARPSLRWDHVPGPMSGDICGSHNSQIVTLVERQTRYVMLVKVTRKDTETVVNALIQHAMKLPQELYKTLTWDRGSELADHKRFTLATDIQVFFCDPRNPWQRGSNENTNGLLRQYFPKGLDLSSYSQGQLDAVANRLNGRARKTLDYETPAQRFYQCVASTG